MRSVLKKVYKLLLCLMLAVTVHQVKAQVLLWGITTKGGANNGGTLYSYDAGTQIYTNRYDFAGVFSGPSMFAGSPIQYNNKIYGIQDQGIYCFDPVTGSINFYGPDPNSFNGNSFGSLALLNGKFYCMAGRGSNRCSILEYDPVSNIITDKYDLDVNNDGAMNSDPSSGYSNGKLTVYNGKLYGLAKTGGTANAYGQTYNVFGTLFEYDPAAGSGSGFTKKMDFGAVASGNIYYNPLGGLTVYNGLLYGICKNADNDNGELFSYDPSQIGIAGFAERHDFGADADGSGTFQEWNGLLTVYNNQLYGTRDAGGTTNTGLMYVYDPNSGQYTKIYDNQDNTQTSLSGATESGNQFYGVNELGSFIYKFDPSTNARTTLYTFSVNSPDAFNPTNELLAIPVAVAPTITFTDFSRTYGDAVFIPAATSTDAVTPITYSITDGDNPDKVISLGADGKVTILKPGIAYITASQGVAPLAATPVRTKVAVNKAVLTVNAKDQTLVINQPIANLPFEYQGWVGTDNTIDGMVTGKPVLTTTATPSSPMGAYPITVSDITGLISVNYTFAVGSPATLTIIATGSTSQTISFAALPSATYGDVDEPLTAKTDAAGLVVSYTSSDINVAVIVNDKIHIVGAGTTVITAKQAGSIIYAAAADLPRTLTVNRAPLTIAADNKNVNRGDPIPALTATYTGFVNGETAAVLNPSATLSTSATVSSAPGLYDIVVAGAASPNYTITLVNGKLTIKGTQLVTWAPLSTLTYGDAPFPLTAASDAGFSPVYTTNNPSIISVANGMATIKGAGTATITATFPAGNGYDLTTSMETITVLKRQLVVKVDDKNRPYGDANPLFTATYTGWVNGDNESSGALLSLPVISTTATATSPVGFYPITAGGAASNNYDPIYISGNLEITIAARTITFNSLASKTYGDATFDPGATGSTGETINYSSSNTNVAVIDNGQIKITGAGTTTIMASLPANSSYNGTSSATQTLMVNKANLTIIADNKAISWGSGDPLLTISFTGFVNGDNQLDLATRPIISTTASDKSAVGEYLIFISGAASDNYTIDYVNGTLTVIPAAGTGDNSLDAWLSSRSQLEVKVFTAKAQHVAIQLIAVSGQRMYSQEYQLNTGLNQYQLPVGNLPVGIYILKVLGEQFTADQKIMIR